MGANCLGNTESNKYTLLSVQNILFAITKQYLYLQERDDQQEHGD